jgi:hypothetical protein
MKSLHSLLFIVIIQACVIQAQTSWQTTHTTDWHSSGSCKLESNTIRVIINPFSIDVEEEAVISAQGTVQSGDPSTLEITGQFELTPGSAVRSMLLWNGKVLLKAKLKDKNAADSAYEKVVDRNQPVFVRHDPAIIRKVGDNTYQFRIYPVAINNSRKIRILYSVPLNAGNVGPRFSIKTAFTYGCDETPNTIPVEFTKSTTVPFAFILNHGSTKKSLQVGATYLIPYADFLGFITDYWGNSYQSGAASISITPDSTSFNRSYSYKLDSTNSNGYYTAIFSGFPDTLSAMIRELLLTDYTLEAKVIVGSKTYISDVPYIGCFGIYLRSESAWDHNVYWTVYKNTGEPAYAFNQTITPDTTSESCRYLPLFWAAKYNLSEKTGNYGALFGFVDDKMSLLALERDSLKSADALQWQTAGVPPLLPSEIFFNREDMPLLPPNNAIFEYSPVITAVKDATKVFKITLLGNNRVAVEFGKRPEGNVSIFVVDLSGRLVYKLDKASVSGHAITFSLPAMLKGVYLMRVTVGKESYQKKFIVK